MNDFIFWATPILAAFGIFCFVYLIASGVSKVVSFVKDTKKSISNLELAFTKIMDAMKEQYEFDKKRRR